MAGATVLSIAGGPAPTHRPIGVAPEPPGVIVEPARVQPPPTFSRLQRWLQLGSDGKRWTDYEVMLDDSRWLSIVVTADEHSSPDELRATCVNITSLVAIWDPRFQIDGEITQISAGTGNRLASCMLREPVPGGRPALAMTELEQALGADRCWTYRCA